MTSAIERLAAAACPCPSHGLEPPYIEGVYQPDHPSAEAWGRRCNHCQAAATWFPRVCQCDGTGALVPGLLKDCACIDLANLPCDGCAPHVATDRFGGWHGEWCDCQDTGKLLIPAAEVLGVLVRVARFIRFDTTSLFSQAWVQVNGKEVSGMAEEPEEALAAALCQALGLEE